MRLSEWELALRAVLGSLPAVIVWLVGIGWCAAQYPKNPVRYGLIGSALAATLLATIIAHILGPLVAGWIRSMSYTSSWASSIPAYAGVTALDVAWGTVLALVYGLPFLVVALAGVFAPVDEDLHDMEDDR